MDDFAIRLISLPIHIGGVVSCCDGFSNIYINADLPREMQLESLRHELIHIKKEHLYSQKAVELCEAEAQEHIHK